MKEEVSKFHALQLFTDTFAAETVHLTNEAIGIYIRLICFCWTKNAKPFTTESAYRICGCKTKECEKIVNLVLNEFFKPEKIVNNPDIDSWTHKRLTAEHEYLTAKYKARSEAGRKGGLAKSDNASSKMIAPIPIPNPIPKININDQFNSFWKIIKSKKGSRFLALQRFEKYCVELDVKDLALKYNRYSDSIKDKQFQKHVSTWINQRCFEDEDERKESFTIDKPLTFEHKGRKLTKRGETGFYYDLIDDDGNRFKKHKWKDEPIIAD